MGSDRVKLAKCKIIKVELGENAIMQVTYFLNDTMFNLLFSYHIISYCEKVTSHDKFRHNLILES